MLLFKIVYTWKNIRQQCKSNKIQKVSHNLGMMGLNCLMVLIALIVRYSRLCQLHLKKARNNHEIIFGSTEK